jgi:hypothetical protein
VVLCAGFSASLTGPSGISRCSVVPREAAAAGTRCWAASYGLHHDGPLPLADDQVQLVQTALRQLRDHAAVGPAAEAGANVSR